MKSALWFGGAMLLIVVVVGAALAIPFSSAADSQAIQVSAVIAVMVQVFSFVALKLVSAPKLMAAWLMGTGLRFTALIAYAFIGVKTFGLPAPAALLSLASFLFLSTLVEPKLLTK